MELQINRKGGLYAAAKDEKDETLKLNGTVFDADTTKVYTAEHPFIKAGWLRKPVQALSASELSEATAQQQQQPATQKAKPEGKAEAAQNGGQPWHNGPN